MPGLSRDSRRTTASSSTHSAAAAVLLPATRAAALESAPLSLMPRLFRWSPFPFKKLLVSQQRKRKQATNRSTCFSQQERETIGKWTCKPIGRQAERFCILWSDDWFFDQTRFCWLMVALWLHWWTGLLMKMRVSMKERSAASECIWYKWKEHEEVPNAKHNRRLKRPEKPIAERDSKGCIAQFPCKTLGI